VEFRITRGDGVFRWIESTAKVFYDEDGSAERIVAVCTDITERKQAEDALRASEGRLRFIADRARAGLWDWDLASGRLEWSPLCKQLFGIPLEETMSYERFLAAVHPEDRDLTDRTNRGYLEGSGGGDYDMEYRVVLPDGAIRWIHAKGSATFEDGKPQRMAGIVLDVTDRKQSQDALRQNEERLRLAHQAAHSGAWEVDVRTREIFWSPELQTLWGLVPGATVDIRGTIRRMIISDDYAAVDKALADVLENRTRDYRCLYRMIRPDGALRWNESFGEVIRDDRGSVIRIVGVTIDITERKQAEEALRRSHLELEHKVEERTRALAASLVSLESEVIVRRQAEEALQGLSARLLRLQDEERRRIARDLHDSTGQTLAALKMTIASLEELVRNVPQAPQIIRDLNAFAEDALKDIRTTSHLLHPPLLDEVGFTSAARWYVDELAKRSGIQIRLELTAAAGGLTKSSELAFFRVLQESLTNVIRHSGSAAVDIRLQGGPDNATLTIQDYGRGIPSDMLNHFQETGAGVGVGLGGMKQRIRELGGQLEVSSDPTGTCVRAVLPTTNAPAGTRQDGRTGDSAPAA
jgi:PAS domain S-box-containing protein